MKIEVYSLPDCPYGPPTYANVRQALAADNVEAEVSFERVEEAEAVAKGLSGSPSVVIDGVEVQPSGSQGFS